jgi:hypothetical protein
MFSPDQKKFRRNFNIPGIIPVLLKAEVNLLILLR